MQDEIFFAQEVEDGDSKPSEYSGHLTILPNLSPEKIALKNT